MLARSINTPTNGVLIQDLAEGSLAAALGLPPGLIPATINRKSMLLGGEVILSIGGKSVSFDQQGIKRAYE